MLDRVDFLGHRDDVPDLLAATDVFVLRSRCEGFPLALLEAMAAEKPIISSRIGGVDELIVDRENGLLAVPGDEAALAAAIRTAGGSAELRRRLGDAARLAGGAFSAGVLAERIECAYERLLRRSGGLLGPRGPPSVRRQNGFYSGRLANPTSRYKLGDPLGFPTKGSTIMSLLRTASRAAPLLAVVAAFAFVAAPAGAATFPLSGSITATDASRANGLQSSAAGSCASPAAASGTIAGPLSYDSSQFLNSSAVAECVSVSVSATTSSGNDGVFISAYASGTDYNASPLATIGISGDCLLAGDSFSFNAAPGGFTVIVEECNPGEGATYSASVSANGVSAISGLAVAFRGFSAVSTRHGQLIRWQTASELDVLGFNVYRQLNGQRVRVNSRLVRATAAGGRAYSLLDRRVAKTARYWIQVVHLDGARTWYGPARTSAPSA